jgi:calcineurin-like phosphoesterase family protein
MTHRPFDLGVTNARFRGVTLPIALYGHIHTNGLKPSEDGEIDEFVGPANCYTAANMGVEMWDYTPQPLENVLQYITQVQPVIGPDDTKKYFLGRGTAAKE